MEWYQALSLCPVKKERGEKSFELKERRQKRYIQIRMQ
jgi:hypothetical protein